MLILPFIVFILPCPLRVIDPPEPITEGFNFSALSSPAVSTRTSTDFFWLETRNCSDAVNGSLE